MKGIFHNFHINHRFLVAVLLVFCFALSAGHQGHAQSKKQAKQSKTTTKATKKKTQKRSKTARKEQKGSNKPFNHRPRFKGTKQDFDKDKTGKDYKKQKKVTTKQDSFSPKSKDRKKQASTPHQNYSMKSSDRKKTPSKSHDDFAVKSKDRSKQPSTPHQNYSMKSSDRKKTPSKAHDDFAVKSKDRSKKPSTIQNKHGVGMIKKSRSEKNKQPIDLSKTKVKVPVVNYRKSDLHKIRHQEKLKTAAMPDRKPKAPTDKTYMIKVKRSHKDGGLPKQNPVEWSLKRSTAKENKNPRPEISKYHGDYKRPTKLYQEVINWKKSRVLLNHFGKLSIARPANGRKEYRKLSRKVSSWQGDIKVLRRCKHQHPSLRFQVYPQKAKGADVRRNNKKLKKAKYDPNERKIWDTKGGSTVY